MDGIPRQARMKPFLHDIEDTEPNAHDMLTLRDDLQHAYAISPDAPGYHERYRTPGSMAGIEDVPAGTRTKKPSEAAQLFASGGYGCIHIPPQLFDVDMQKFAIAIVHSVQRMEPAYTPMHKAVYRTLTRLADQKVKATPTALVLALLLAAAKIHDIRIKTHPRDLAKEVGVRYATLLKIRKAAMVELAAI